MALKVTDPSTWRESRLSTPEGPISYWVLADWNTYFEQFEDVNNQTVVSIAVAWDDAGAFKSYALGYAQAAGGGATYLDRFTPLAVPWATGQYLTSLRKIGVHAGVTSAGVPVLHSPSDIYDNWPTFEPTDGMPPRIVYSAVFSCPTYDIVSQSSFVGAGSPRELKRFVTRERQVNPRERKVPSYGFETAEATPQIIPEVGFIPYYDYELYYTWKKIPLALVPDTAIANCLLKVNNATFDYKADGTYGKYRVGDILFKGLANRITPYRGPNGEWLVDLAYTFSFQPGDGTGNGQLKVPRNGNTWILVRQRGSSASPKYLYQSADLDTLFQPEP